MWQASCKEALFETVAYFKGTGDAGKFRKLLWARSSKGSKQRRGERSEAAEAWPRPTESSPRPAGAAGEPFQGTLKVILAGVDGPARRDQRTPRVRDRITDVSRLFFGTSCKLFAVR